MDSLILDSKMNLCHITVTKILESVLHDYEEEEGVALYGMRRQSLPILEVSLDFEDN
jgi:hypothetical protein